MESKGLNKVWNNIDYNTYLNLRYASIIGCLGFLSAEEINKTNSLPLTVTSWVCLLAYYYMCWSKGELHTKDVKKINAFYQEFLDNYTKLNKIFGLDNPLEIYLLFNHMLYNGYLSKSKNFELGKVNLRDIRKLLSRNVFNGTGVCRHTTSLLRDILNNQGITAGVLTVRSRGLIINLEIIEEKKYSLEELMDKINGKVSDDTANSVREKMKKLIDDDVNLDVSLEWEKANNIIKKIIGNHSIVVASQDDYGFFLDPTLKKTYQLDRDNDKALLCDFLKTSITYFSTFVFNGMDEYKRVKDILNNIQEVQCENEEMKRRIAALFENNMDIVEQFYQENQELYEEIGNKLLKLRKSIV